MASREEIYHIDNKWKQYKSQYLQDKGWNHQDDTTILVIKIKIDKSTKDHFLKDICKFLP